jgi:N-acetylglucosaminyl-diphospho-decaprenol L-rhamnosyltransferase
MMDIAVVIVGWNVSAVLKPALKSLYQDLAASSLEAEVWYVDCASEDDSLALVERHFPMVCVIASEKNLGFAGGNNAAFQAIGLGPEHRASDDLPAAVYLLNPDTITQPGATRTLFDALIADPDVGMVGARLSYADGAFQHSAFRFPGLGQLWAEFFPLPGRLIEGRFNGRYPMRLYDSGRPFDVDCILGATMMVRAEALQAVGTFDEGYFMYVEEIDLAWRMRQAGWVVRCAPNAHVVHLGGQSTGLVRARSVVNLWESRFRFYRKTYSGAELSLAKLMIRAGIQRRMRRAEEDASLAEPTRSEILGAYRHVLELAR